MLGLAAANLLAWAAAGLAALAYARQLQAADFAHWTAALAIARGALLLLDGGLKTALVRRASAPDAITLQRLRRQGGWLALALSALLALAALATVALGVWPTGAAAVLALIPAAYLLPYPWLLPALARLERAQRFGVIGRAEAGSVLVEFALPAGLMAAGLPWWQAFVLAALAGRALRSATLAHAARTLGDESDAGGAAPPSASAARHWRGLLRAGLGVQAVTALSLLRDHVHLWWVGPLFGAAWAGQYGFALNACALIGQVAVQTAARAALPRLRLLPAAQRWPEVLAQTRLLAVCALPPLALLPAWLAWADARWWQGRWHEALALLPWLALRMLPSVATTTVGAWLMVARQPRHAAAAHARWTAAELLLVAAATAVAGPQGLAIAWALGGWCGLALLLAAAEPAARWAPRLAALLRVLVLRPSLWLALALAAGLAWLPAPAQARALPWLTLALPLVWLAEPATWRARQTGRRRQAGPAPQDPPERRPQPAATRPPELA